MPRGKQKRASSEEFLKVGEVLWSGTKHPQIKFEHPERWRGQK
jgi:hypothetical protein